MKGDGTRHVGPSEASHRDLELTMMRPMLQFQDRTSWRKLLALAAVRGWKVRQADAVTAFLNGPIDNEIYAQFPKGYEQEDMVCRLKKSVYGLKEAPKIWWETLSKKLREMGMRQLVSDSWSIQTVKLSLTSMLMTF
jgi:Reverse transcriptase (RNA-dependent DNA polymerase)